MTTRRTSQAGFTLVELMVGATLAAMVMAAALTAYTFIGRNLARLASYQALENESRKALNYLSRDFALALGVKNGTTPTTATVTLTLPSGDVTYTYNGTARSLSRVATFGTSPNLTFLNTSSCECTTFALRYFTTSDGSPVDQMTATANIPYSIKQIQVGYTVESPTTWSLLTRTRYQIASARFLLRNRTTPDGT